MEDTNRKGSIQQGGDAANSGDDSNLPPATSPSESDVNSGANAGEKSDDAGDNLGESDPGPVPDEQG